MLTRYPFDSLGHADHGWLNARHHFSFARYFDKNRMGFGALRVVNDDRIAAGQGFGAHPHDNMEIITYVRRGAISHKDSLGNEGRTEAGNVQVMSAGTGVFHSEYNSEPEETTLYQIWIIPNENGVTPRWEMKEFPQTPVTGSLPLLVSGREEHAGSGALYIHQDAAIYGGKLSAGSELTQQIKYLGYLLVSEGEVVIDGVTLTRGDGAEITQTNTVTIRATTDAELLLIDVPN